MTIVVVLWRKGKSDGEKDGRVRESEIEDQYSPDRTKGSRDMKTHARNADGNSFVSRWRESREFRRVPWLSCGRKPWKGRLAACRVEARLRSSILGPIFIVLYEPHNSHQLPSTSLILHQTASDCRRYAHVGNTEFFYSSIDEIVTVIISNQSGGSSEKNIV